MKSTTIHRMKVTVHRILLLTCCMLLASCAERPAWFMINHQDMTVCEARTPDGTPPDFDDPACQQLAIKSSVYAGGEFRQLNPQNRHLWVRASLEISAERLADPTPLALLISGKAASRVFLNGEFLGANGVPAATAGLETPGLMDAYFFVRHDQLQAGRNEVVAEMSGHHSIFDLSSPIHWILISDYGDPVDFFLRHYWPSLLVFGVLLLSTLYLSTLYLFGQSSLTGLLLMLISGFATLQLAVEFSRGIVSYTYPFHDLRLATILACSLGFGLCSLAYVTLKFGGKHRTRVFLVSATVTVAAAWLAPGFDFKSVLAFLIPTFAALFLTAAGIRRGQPWAGRFTAALAVFAAVMNVAPGAFLDIYLYYVLSGLLLFLAAHQAISLADERRVLAAERARADRLEMALDQKREAEEPAKIPLSSAGRVQMVLSSDIAYCQGSGDYVEIVMTDQSQLLHTGTLASLEEVLPATFLRVHRSYLVNTSLVQTLKREASGTGILLLDNGSSVPVSRRIMPAVRRALA